MDFLETLLDNPGAGTPILILSVCIGIPVTGAVIVSLARLVMRHRERIAMIEQGIHPDHPDKETGAENLLNGPGELSGGAKQSRHPPSPALPDTISYVSPQKDRTG